MLVNHGYWEPLPANASPPYYYTRHGEAWHDEPYSRAACLMGQLNMLRARGAPRAGLIARHIGSGLIDSAGARRRSRRVPS